MKTKFILFTFLVITSCLKDTFAQSPNFFAGEELKNARDAISLSLSNDEIVFYAGNAGSSVMGMTLSIYKVNRQSLKTTLNQTHLNSFLFENNSLRYFSLPDKLIAFYPENGNKNGAEKLQYQITENSSSVPGEIKEIDLGSKNLKKNDNSTTSSILYYNVFYNFIVMSKNKDKFLFINNIENDEKKRVSRIIEIDAVTMQVEKELIFNLGINNFGAGSKFHNDFVYSLVEIVPENNEESNYYKLIGVSLKKEIASFEYELNFSGKTIETCNFDIGKNGEILITGTFSNTSKSHFTRIVDGMYFHKLNGQTGKMISESDTKFDLKDIQFLTGRPNSDKVGKVKANFTNVEFITLDNGSINVIMEDGQYGIEKTIVIANINQKGEYNWVRLIPKRQEYENFTQELASYSCKVDDNKLTLVYMDNKNNYDDKTKMILKDKMLSIKNIKTAKKNSNSLAMVTIDENGNVEHKLLADTGDYSCFSQKIVWSKSGDELYLITIKHTYLLNISKIKLN